MCVCVCVCVCLPSHPRIFITIPQPVLALRCLEVLLCVSVSGSSPLSHQLQPSYNGAVSLYIDLLLSTIGPSCHSLPKPYPVPTLGELGRREMVELRCSQMLADLATVRIQLACGHCDDARRVLLSILSEPVLEQASTLTYLCVAKAKLLTSEILQQRTFDLRSCDDFFHHVLNDSDGSGDDRRDYTFRLTPLELAMDAVKIFQKLANHRSVKVAQDSTTGKSTRNL